MTYHRSQNLQFSVHIHRFIFRYFFVALFWHDRYNFIVIVLPVQGDLSRVRILLTIDIFPPNVRIYYSKNHPAVHYTKRLWPTQWRNSMYIRCWGSRGSIPVSGKSYIKYGGDTTCMEVRAESGDVIVIDAGSGMRLLGNKLLTEAPSTISLLFTHAHWDHLLGFGFFKPVFRRGTRINIYGCPFSLSSYQFILQGLMSAPYFPVDLKNVKAAIKYNSITTKKFHIGSIEIMPIYLNHPNGGLGYKFTENGNSFVFLTDNELAYQHPLGLEFKDYLKFCEGADLLIHDAEFTPNDYPKSWGHSQFTDTVKLGVKANVGTLGLFHLNQDRTDALVDDMVANSITLIKKAKSTMKCKAIGYGFEMKL